MRSEDEIWEDQAYQNGSGLGKRFRQKTKSSSTDNFSPNLKEIVGECYKCTHYHYVINDVHQLVHSSCSILNIILGKHCVKECSSFAKRQEMSLTYMFSIATYIEASQKDKPGFLTKKKD